MVLRTKLHDDTLGGMARNVWYPVHWEVDRIRARYEGRNIQLSPDGEIHAPADTPWLRGVQVVGPACRTAAGTHDPDRWIPTLEAVSCLHCLRLRWPDHPLADDRQLTLFDLEAVA